MLEKVSAALNTTSITLPQLPNFTHIQKPIKIHTKKKKNPAGEYLQQKNKKINIENNCDMLCLFVIIM